jgi:serine protease Do
MTNDHVVRGPRTRITLWDGRTFDGEVTGRDHRRDLAAVRIPVRELPSATVGNSDTLRPGEVVIAVGNPMGFIGALATGVVHALGALRGLGRRTWVQAAVRLAPGNSGGPLADARGRVVGLNTMIVSGGLALAVPSNTVAQFLERGGPRATLGVTVQEVREGLLILEVSGGSSAEAASLRRGDILIDADGQRLESVDDLGDAIEQSSGVLKLDFLRGDRARRQVAVQLKVLGAAAA